MDVQPTALEWIGTLCFALAVLHTFLSSLFEKWSGRYPKGSIRANLFHLLGEVEIVFGLWAAIFVGIYTFIEGFALHGEGHRITGGAIYYLESLNFTEPAFVFTIMTVAATRPIILLAEKIITFLAKWPPLPPKMAFYFTVLVFGPLLGSFITEPAAMTVTALILLNYFYSQKMSQTFMYATLGLLFVNISIGGTLTHFAAPPVLMVAAKWHWDTAFMMGHFGHKAVFAVILSTLITCLAFRKELSGPLKVDEGQASSPMQPTWWLTSIHVLFLALVVYSSHHSIFFLGLLLFFLGFVTITEEYQDTIKLKEALLVGFFLAGLIVLGGMQGWWLRPLLASMSDLALFVGTAGLTAFTDNAALTYLGSLVELSDSAKYNLVAGAVAGGGLTVIANAPNPAGFGILKSSFGASGINPLGLLLGALVPTVLAMLCFQILPDL